MRFIKKQLSLWRIVLIIGVAAIAIPIASRVSPTAIAVVKERQDYLASTNHRRQRRCGRQTQQGQ